MSRSHEEERFPAELGEVAELLREQRPSLDPLALDRIKLRAMRASRSPSSRHGRFSMRSRLTTLIAAGLLTVGAGGAFALDGGVGGGQGHSGSASFSQYCEHGTHGPGENWECHGGEAEHDPPTPAPGTGNGHRH